MVKTKNRGISLTIWLSIMLVANIIAFFGYFLNLGLSSAVLNINPYLVFLILMFSFLNIISVIFLFLWKKWAFYILCISAVIVFIINLIVIDFQLMSSTGLLAIAGLVSPVILFLLLRSRWKFLEKQERPLLLVIILLIVIILLGIYFQFSKNTISNNVDFSIKRPADWDIKVIDNLPDHGHIKFISKNGDELGVICDVLVESGYWKNTLNITSIESDINNPKNLEDKNYEIIYSGPTKVERFQKFDNYETIVTKSYIGNNKALANRGDKIYSKTIRLVSRDRSCYIYVHVLPERTESVYPVVEKSINTFRV